MNRCCELARGEIVIVWDDDDWYAPDRISRQVAPFSDPSVLLTGTSRLYYYVHGTRRAYRYHNWTDSPWLAAFALRKSVWERQKFEPLPYGADTRLIQSLPRERLKDLNDLTLMVATIHPTNAASKSLPNMSFIETPWGEIEKVTGREMTPNALIAVISCEKYKNRVEALRETWIPIALDAGFDVQVFTGQRLGVPDDYASLPLKTKALCQWAFKEGYEHLLKIDDDTCVDVSNFHIVTSDYAGIRIKANDYGSPDLANSFDKPKGTYPHHYASGGAYWLSRRSMKLVAEAPFNGDWAEDRWVGQTLAGAGIELDILPDYAFWSPGCKATVCTQFATPNALKRFFHGEEIFPSQPDIPPSTPFYWKNTLLDKKVKALFKRFRYVQVTTPKSDHYKQLCQIYPDHLEELIDTPEGRRIIFIVKKEEPHE
jgi:hypothetical protein